MIGSPKTSSIKKVFFLIVVFLIVTDFVILLNISFLRQILGFLFLTILPGLLILQILKLNKLGLTEKFVLLVGLSISFLMFFGLLINNLSLSLGYETPLATIPLLISFNIAFTIFGIIGYKINKEPIFSLPNPNLSMSEKAFLIVPILFPALSILGTHLMKTADNNIILMFLFFLIPIYVIFVCFFHQKFPKRMYPVVIFLIEAMACGTPVLATPVGAIPGVITDGETGFIMENNSPECIAKNVVRALEHPDLERIVENATVMVEREFTYDAAVERYRKILKELQ